MTPLIELRERMAARATELDELARKSERTDDDETRDRRCSSPNSTTSARNSSARSTSKPRSAPPAITRTRSAPGRCRRTATGTRLVGHPPRPPRQPEQRDHRPLADRFADSTELTDYRARPSGKSAPFVVGSFFRTRNVPGMETRNLITDTGLVAPADRLPGIYGPTRSPTTRSGACST